MSISPESTTQHASEIEVRYRALICQLAEYVPCLSDEQKLLDQLANTSDNESAKNTVRLLSEKGYTIERTEEAFAAKTPLDFKLALYKNAREICTVG